MGAALLTSALSLFPPNAAAARPSVTYELTGSFARNGERAALPWARPRENIDAFDSYGGSDAKTGTFRSAVFRAPAEIHFFVSGFPSLPGMRLYLLDEKRQRSIDLTSRVDSALEWRMHYWQIPKAWQGVPVRVVAEDNGTGLNAWIGVTIPEAGAQSTMVSLIRALQVNGTPILLGLLFVVPGLAGCALFLRRTVLDLKTTVTAILVISSLCGCCVFGFYLISPSYGRNASIGFMLASFTLLLFLFRRLYSALAPIRRELAACLLAVLLAGVFSSSLGNLYITDDDFGEAAQVRYRPGMPPDNVLPQIFADRLYNGVSVRPTIFSYWHSSDRPPLETAIDLMEMRFIPPHRDVLAYQSLGIFLQCTWVAGVWVLLRTAGVRVRHIGFCIAACLFSYFCLFHSFYVWAKLLSATFCLLSLSFFPFIQPAAQGLKPTWTVLNGILAGAAMALSMLCHPGIAFTAAGILVVAAYTRTLPSFRICAIALASAALFLLPWQAYQKFYDPPGDNLMKAHLAGVIDFNRTLTECVVTAYRNLTFHQWALNKWENVKVLFYGEHLVKLLAWNPDRILAEFLECTFFYLIFTVGILNAGFLVRLWRRGEPSTSLLGARLLTVAAVSLFLWCLVMFEPGSTVVHQGSFATVLLIFVGLALWLVNGAPNLAAILLAIQIAIVYPIFVFSRTSFVRSGTIGDAPLDPVMGCVAMLCLVAFAFFFRRIRA